MRFGFGLELTDIRRTPPAPSLAAYYGTGLGQVSLHLAPEDAVLDASGNVLSVPNKGGAGAAFAATASGIGVKLAGNRLSLPNDGSRRFLQLAQPANFLGVRMFAVVAFDPAPSSSPFVGIAGRVGNTEPGNRTVIRTSGDGRNMALTRWSGSADDSVFVTGTLHPGTALRLVEIEIAGGFVRSWLDGAPNSASVTVHPGWADFLVDRIFSGSVTGTVTGQAGDVVSMVTDGSAAMDVRAAEIRSIIAAKHGITLP